MGNAVIKPGSTPLVQREIEYQPASRIRLLPADMKALFVLYSHAPESQFMNVRYVGYASNENGNDIRSLLQQQYRLNGRLWSHFSVYELWDYFQKGDTMAVEALFRHVYRHDSQLKGHLAKNRRDITRDSAFIPKALFVSFIDRIARTSTKLGDDEPTRSVPEHIRA